MNAAVLKRQLAAALVAATASSMAVASNYSFIMSFNDFGTPNNPQPDVFTLTNGSDIGITIQQIIIDLSGASNAPVFDTLDGASAAYFYGNAAGVPVTGLNTALVGFVTPTEAQQASWEESPTITLDFTDFDNGETFAFTTDVDDTMNFFVSGAEFAGATLTVAFSDSFGNQYIDSAVFQNALGTQAPNDAFAAVKGTLVPVPGALLLLLSAVGGSLGFARRRR